MRTSQFFFTTLKEAPSDAEVISQKMMLRAGYIKRAAAGIYTWMPLGLRVLRKVENIVREEMNNAGALELLMPAVQPAELWQESGRWEQYGPELLRFKDRHQREFVICPIDRNSGCNRNCAHHEFFGEWSNRYQHYHQLCIHGLWNIRQRKHNQSWCYFRTINDHRFSDPSSRGSFQQ